MPDLTDDQRRVWRLALLVAGRVDRADEALLSVVRRRASLASMPAARQDRLTLICVRELAGEAAMRRPAFLERMRAAHRLRRGAPEPGPAEPVASPFTGLAGSVIEHAAALREQPREAWMLHRVLNLDLRDVARAMDCSKTAAARHLEEAETAMARSLAAEYTNAIEAVRAQSATAMPGPLVLETLAARRSARVLIRIAVAMFAIAVLTAAAAGILHWLRSGAP